MLELQDQLAPISDMAISGRDEVQRAINRVESEIDYLVYELYGLTTAERAIVEDAT